MGCVGHTRIYYSAGSSPLSFSLVDLQIWLGLEFKNEKKVRDGGLSARVLGFSCLICLALPVELRNVSKVLAIQDMCTLPSCTKLTSSF